MALSKVRIQLLDPETGQVLEEVDALTSPDSVIFADGETLQEKLSKISPGDILFSDGKTLNEKIDEVQKAEGPKGETGTSMRMKGSWEAGTAYVNNTQYIDIVTWGGNTYACKTGHTSGASFDAAKWTLTAQKGATGTAGATGAKGATGPAGKDGDNVKFGTAYNTAAEVKLFLKKM